MNHGQWGRKEGLVVGSHYDYAVRPPPFPSPSVIPDLLAYYGARTQGRQIVEVQLEPGEIYHAWCDSLVLSLLSAY